MPTITFEESDILSTTLVDPAWYPCKIESVEEKLSKAGDSNVFIVSMTIIGGKFKGVPLVRYFSDKPMARRFMIPFMNAVFGKVGSGDSMELDDAVGSKLLVHVTQEENDGMTRNVAQGFKAYKAKKAPKKVAPPVQDDDDDDDYSDL